MEKKTAAKWWDKLGKPQYGDELVIRSARNIVNFDPYNGAHLTQIYAAWLERLFSEDWTVDPASFEYKTMAPNHYLKGLLAESWEFSDPSTFVVHLRKGIHWQHIPPVNGRELTADDVAFHYHRLFGLGSGFTKPAPYHATVASFRELISVTAVDKHTVAFNWKTNNPAFISETMITNHNPNLAIVAREAVEKWGDVSDWHHAIGTGPFILQDFVPNVGATLVKNPGYWGHDERYPQNKLPYIDKLRILIIPEEAEALEAMRTGRLDAMDSISFNKAKAMQKSNPEILQIPSPTGASIDPRNDVAPFNDIRVRKVMQMAIDLRTIAATYYGGAADPSPSSFSSSAMSRWGKGWGFPYQEWPQDLKDEYAYNPALAKKLLAEAGYPNGFKTNIVADIAADLDLLQVVKSYFQHVGIDMEIRTMESAAWVRFVQYEKKHDQLAYHSGGSLHRAHEPLRQLTMFQTGSSSNPHMAVSDPVYDSFYDKAIAAHNEEEVKKIFRDANQYVARQHFAICLVQPMQYSLYQPWFNGYHGQFGAISWSPPSLSFYTARFWIDRELKKKMGH
jgi:peptide/nickel transport system substrate-binding protein